MINRQGQIRLGEAMTAGMFWGFSIWCFNIVQYMLGHVGRGGEGPAVSQQPRLCGSVLKIIHCSLGYL